MLSPSPFPDDSDCDCERRADPGYLGLRLDVAIGAQFAIILGYIDVACLDDLDYLNDLDCLNDYKQRVEPPRFFKGIEASQLIFFFNASGPFGLQVLLRQPILRVGFKRITDDCAQTLCCRDNNLNYDIRLLCSHMNLPSKDSPTLEAH